MLRISFRVTRKVWLKIAMLRKNQLRGRKMLRNLIVMPMRNFRVMKKVDRMLAKMCKK